MMLKLRANQITYISESVVRALTQNRITTISEFLQEDATKIAAVTKLNLPEVLAARNEIFERYSAPIINGTALLTQDKRKWVLSTGLECLDTILEGGLPIGYMTEICGLAETGKTQLCFQLAINCVKGSENTVLYIDTKGDFSAIRIQKILNESGFSHKEMAQIMHKIKVIRIWDLEETIELLQNLKNKSIQTENLVLIILDSLPCLMFQFLGDDNKIGLSMLNSLVNYSRYLCRELEICMIFTNIQTRWVDQDVAELEDDGDASTMMKDAFVEKRNRCLGKYWQNIPNLVLLLEKLQKSGENTRVEVMLSVMMCNNPKLESRKCSLQISALGVTS